MAHRRWEREQGRRDVTEDMSEYLSEGEKGDALGELVQPETPRKRFQRNLSNLEVWSDDKKEKKLYIVLVRYDSLAYFPVMLKLEEWRLLMRNTSFYAEIFKALFQTVTLH